jgi:hypothetical protein
MFYKEILYSKQKHPNGLIWTHLPKMCANMKSNYNQTQNLIEINQNNVKQT